MDNQNHQSQPIPIRCKGNPTSEGHNWKMFYPRRDFYFRECLDCGRKQYYVDENTWYDIETKSFLDKKGLHSIRDFDGYIEDEG